MKDSLEALRALWFPTDLDDPEAVEAATARWFAPDDAFDHALRASFADLPELAARAARGPLADAPRDALSLVLALDQLPRNLHRGEAQAFAYDEAALDLAERSIARGHDTAVHPIEASFFYLPFEHAESRTAQDRCIALFAALCDRAPPPLRERFDDFLAFAERHRAVIGRFGRFPHRNAALGRPSSDAEIRYLEGGGETFGAGDD